MSLFTFLYNIILVSTVVGQAKTVDDRNVMLNAKSASVPREINIGLPETGNGSSAMVDGTFHATGLLRAHFHWPGGVGYESPRVMGLVESVIKTGEVERVLDVRSKLGGGTLSGAIIARTSSNGLIHVNGNVNGPLSRKNSLYCSGSVYVNLDPTSVHSPSRLFIDNKQSFQVSLMKRFKNGGELAGIYRLSLTGDRAEFSYAAAPFIYNGNGTISRYNGFKLGRDCYMPADETVRYMDVVTGQIKTKDLSKMDKRIIHDATLSYSNRNLSGWSTDFTFHLFLLQLSPSVLMDPAGVKRNDDGTLVQNRLARIYDNGTTGLNLRATADKVLGNHIIKLGLDAVCAKQNQAVSSAVIAHTINSNPERVTNKLGESSWNFNCNSTFLDAWRLAFPLYAFDEWYIRENILLRTGVRVSAISNRAKVASVEEGDSYNVRVAGFNLADPTLCKLRDKSHSGVDFTISEHFNWTLGRHFFVTAEGFFGMTNKPATSYTPAILPSLDPTGNAYARLVLGYRSTICTLRATASYITRWNCSSVDLVTNPNNPGDVLTWTGQYGIRTPGITVDGNLSFSGFNLHALMTWQSPKYSDYRNNYVFSDGTRMVIDYTGKYVTGISQFLVEVDPSYQWSRYRVWLSGRYNSRQYASRTNLAYFNGHFETFAGTDVQINSHHKVSLNIINLLCQNGVQGKIDSVDSIVDVEQLKGIVVAGTYIRPFTVELSYRYSF